VTPGEADLPPLIFPNFQALPKSIVVHLHPRLARLPGFLGKCQTPRAAVVGEDGVHPHSEPLEKASISPQYGLATFGDSWRSLRGYGVVLSALCSHKYPSFRPFPSFNECIFHSLPTSPHLCNHAEMSLGS
jgi:hypothetical protein